MLTALWHGFHAKAMLFTALDAFSGSSTRATWLHTAPSPKQPRRKSRLECLPACGLLERSCPPKRFLICLQRWKQMGHGCTSLIFKVACWAARGLICSCRRQQLLLLLQLRRVLVVPLARKWQQLRGCPRGQGGAFTH